MYGILEGRSLVRTGAISGETSATACPAFPCKWVLLKAQSGNAGNVYVGVTSGVTKPTDSTSDATTGFELDAGQEAWFKCPGDDLSGLYIICDNTGDDLTYQAYR